MIRRGRYKFVHSPVDPDQLYDLVGDPDERRNLAPEAEHRDRVGAYRAEVAQRWDFAKLQSEVLASQRRRHLVNDALRRGRYVPWDFQPVRDASRLYVRNDQDLGDLEAQARFPPFGS
jgi:choline-sulfatase